VRNPELIGLTCPTCEGLLDDASCQKNPSAKPKPGNLSVCIHCTTFLIFDSDMSLKVQSVEDIRNLDHEDLSELMRIKELILP